MRIKVKIDITKPLRKWVIFDPEEDGELIWIPIKYEWLLDFCYGCGMVDHKLKECSHIDKEVEIKKGLKYRPWMRASQPVKGRNFRKEKNKNNRDHPNKENEFFSRDTN